MSSNRLPKRILVAEDDPSISHLLVMQLRMEGYQVTHKPDGLAAWEELQNPQAPDLILLDVLMPKMDGYEVCRLIRQTPHLETLPVVFLTALQDSASRLEGLEAGANDFLAKPWNKAELYARIRTLLRLNEVQDALQKQHQRLGLLYNISRELSSFLNLDQLLSLMLVRSANAVDATRGSVVLFDEKRTVRKLELSTSQEPPSPVIPPALSPSEKLLASWLFKYQRSLLVADTAGKESFQAWSGVRSFIVAPFILQEQVLGYLLLLHDQPNQFDSEHLNLLESISRQATISIDNVGLFERVRKERRRFATLISSMDDAVIATNKDQEIILVNPAGAHLLGIKIDKLEKQLIRDAIKAESLTSLFQQVADRGQAWAKEITWGDDRTLYVTVSPVGEGGQVAVIQDITRIKQLQAMQLAAEQEKTARVRATFERYMSPALVDRALSEERGLMEKRVRRQAAVLFADLRGFTRLTLHFAPDNVVEILNEFFTVMTGIAHSHSGTIIDIAGDELMLAFGVPFDLPDPIASALQAAVKMQTVFTSLSEKWWAAYGDRHVGMGIGIDYGQVVVGNVGSPTRMNYALVGLAVNTAHALVATAADGDIRFSEAVMSRLNQEVLQFPVTAIPDVRLKGRDRDEIVYSMSFDRPHRADGTDDLIKSHSPE